MGRVYAQLAAIRISTLKEKYELGVDLEDEGKCFIHRCVCNDPTSCESILQSPSNPGRLVKRKDPNSNSALSLVCIDSHLEIDKLLCKHNAELESINEEGKTPLMITLLYGHGAIASHFT